MTLFNITKMHPPRRRFGRGCRNVVSGIGLKIMVVFREYMFLVVNDEVLLTILLQSHGSSLNDACPGGAVDDTVEMLKFFHTGENWYINSWKCIDGHGNLCEGVLEGDLVQSSAPLAISESKPWSRCFKHGDLKVWS